MPDRFEILDSDNLHRGFMRLVRYRLRHECFDGGWSAPQVRERIEGLRAVSVLLFDPDLDEVVLVEQFRVGAMNRAAGPWVLETVGGYWPEQEAPEQVARREVAEETGCAVLGLKLICEFLVSPGISSEVIRMYCARVDAAQAAGVHGLPEEGEETRPVRLPTETALAMIESGAIDTTSAIMGLQWLALHRRESIPWGVGSPDKDIR